MHEIGFDKAFLRYSFLCLFYINIDTLLFIVVYELELWHPN